MDEHCDRHRETAIRPRARSRLLFPVLAACLASNAPSAAERLAPGASSCSECHGSGRAEGELASLATLSADEIEAALAAFRSGARGGTIMPRIAKGFSKHEAHAIAVSLGRGGKTE